MTARPISLRTVLLAGAVYAFVESFYLLAPILLSFGLVLLITLAVDPMISRIRSVTGGRRSATILAAIATVVLLAFTGWTVVGPAKDSVTAIMDEWPRYWERLQKPLIKMEQQALISEGKLQAEVSTEITQDAKEEGKPAPPTPPPLVEGSPNPAALAPTQIRSRLSQMAEEVLGSFTALAVNGGQMLLVLVTVFFGVVFTLLNPRPIFGAIFALVPEQHHPQTVNILRRFATFVRGWAAATLLGMLLIGFLVFLLMWPIFGFMDALVLGAIAGLLEAIPFVGPVLSAIPAFLLALSEGGVVVAWVTLAYVSIQAVENNLVVPFIMARGTKVHPVAIIFAMLVSVAAFGLLGVLVAAPLVGVVSIVHDEIYRKRFLPTTPVEDCERLAGEVLR